MDKRSVLFISGRLLLEGEDYKVLLDINNAYVLNVDDPQPGDWLIEVTSSEPHTIRVTGLSSMDFSHGFSRLPVSSMIQTIRRPIGGEEFFLGERAMNETNNASCL